MSDGVIAKRLPDDRQMPPILRLNLRRCCLRGRRSQSTDLRKFRS